MHRRFATNIAKSGDCLRNHFLLAMPQLSEGIFSQSITYIASMEKAVPWALSSTGLWIYQ